MDSNRQKLQQCGVCGETLGGMNIYRCSYCGEAYCSEHRLPENHSCLGINSKGGRQISNNQFKTYTPHSENKRKGRTLTIKSILIICTLILLLLVAGVAIMTLNNKSDMIVGTWGEVPQQLSSDSTIVYIFYSDNTVEANQVDQNGQTTNSIFGTWGKLSNNQYQIIINGQTATITFDPSTGLLNNQLKKQGPPPQSTPKPQDSIIGNWHQISNNGYSYGFSSSQYSAGLSYHIIVTNDNKVEVEKMLALVDGQWQNENNFAIGKWIKTDNGVYLFI